MLLVASFHIDASMQLETPSAHTCTLHPRTPYAAAGMMHWIMNPTCARARLIATFPVGANIQFVFPALRSMPEATLETWYLAGPLPTNQGSPLHQDPACVAACAAAAGGDAAAAPAVGINGLMVGWTLGSAPSG